jgi:hypothetical protein
MRDLLLDADPQWSSYPARAGYPVRRGFTASSLTYLEYWITRRRVMTAVSYLRTVVSDISAELFASSASSAEIAAVCFGVPQLGASLPSPQARGR